LLISGIPATGVIGSGSNYFFTFPQPPYGEVEIAWANGHGITDFGWPTVLPFNELSPDAQWEYQLIDRTPPTIIARTPSAGSTVCTSGNYARKHSPWINFSNVPAADSLPFSSFPTSYSSLPTVSFVIPNLQDDMHDGTIAKADTWLKTNLSAYATWAQSNNSLLIVTWDEDAYTESNQIPTIVVGQHVATGSYNETITHYNLLRTLEQMYGLTPTGSAASATAITDIWN